MGRWQLDEFQEEPSVPEKAKAVMSDRVSWQCPECGRSFRIPASKPRPAWCPDCAAAMGSGEGDIDFDVPASAPKPKFNPSVTVKKTSEPQRANEPRKSSGLQRTSEPSRGTPVPSRLDSSSPPRAPQTDSEHDDKQRQILDELAKISGTMKLFRRLAWGMAIATILNVVLMVVGLVYLTSTLSSGGGLLESVVEGDAGVENGNVDDRAAARADLDRLPPGIREKIKPIEDYERLLNELAKEPQ